jgi:hypothetical protein
VEKVKRGYSVTGYCSRVIQKQFAALFGTKKIAESTFGQFVKCKRKSGLEARN